MASLSKSNMDELYADIAKSDNSLLAHIAKQVQEYNENILPLMPADDADAETSDNSFETFDVEKNEFLENLWDVILQRFTDNGDVQ